MRLPINLGLKIYLCLFAIICASSLTALLIPEGGTFIYYNTLLTFNERATTWYTLAIFDATLSCLAVIPIFRRAFNLPLHYEKFFQLLFFLRLAGLTLGHNYEYLVLKAAFRGTPLIGWITIAVWFLFIFPSFKEHYSYAFKK